MTHCLTIDLAKMIYGTLKSDELLKKECAGIYTHVPIGTKTPYLIYAIEDVNLLSFLLKKTEGFNRAHMRLSISCATQGSSLVQALRIVQKVRNALEGTLLQGVSGEGQRTFVSICRSQSQKLAVDMRGDLQFTTLLFDAFVRF
jgi:hypothetical protein